MNLPIPPDVMAEAKRRHLQQRLGRHRLRMEVRAAVRREFLEETKQTIQLPQYGPEILTLMKQEAERLGL